MADYTATAPYPNRQLYLCQDALGRLCAASAIYSVSGTAAQGGGTFFDWLTTPDGGHTFQNAAVPVGSKLQVIDLNHQPLGGSLAFAAVSKQTNLPSVFSTVGSRVLPSGSGEDAASWQRQVGADGGFGEYYPRTKSATKDNLLLTPATFGGSFSSYFLMTKPADEDKFSFAGLYSTFSAGGFIYTSFYVHHSHDGGRSAVQSAKMPLRLPAEQFTNPDAVSTRNPTTPGRTLPYMIPAKNGDAGSGPGLMPRCRVLNPPPGQNQQAWSLACLCTGESADTLYAIGAYTVTHPDTGNPFLAYYLIKSLDCGLSWASFDPAAPPLVSETTYAGPNDPPNYGYDVQPDGSFLIHPYPPIVFPVCGANGLPPCLPSQPTLPQGDYEAVSYTLDTRKPQMVFAHGTLYAALPATVFALLSDRYRTKSSFFSYALGADGVAITKEYPINLPITAYDWVFVRSGDLGRTWEGLTSPPPMQYGALGLSRGGDRLHWGLHHHSDDGGHTWVDN